jgi:hypothetical protein
MPWGRDLYRLPDDERANVILDADPLENISNVRRVHAVVASGRMMLPAALWQLAGFAP